MQIAWSAGDSLSCVFGCGIAFSLQRAHIALASPESYFGHSFGIAVSKTVA
jgi:hypothetical protein